MVQWCGLCCFHLSRSGRGRCKALCGQIFVKFLETFRTISAFWTRRVFFRRSGPGNQTKERHVHELTAQGAFQNKVQSELCLFSWGKISRTHKNGRNSWTFRFLALSLVRFAVSDSWHRMAQNRQSLAFSRTQFFLWPSCAVSILRETFATLN